MLAREGKAPCCAERNRQHQNESADVREGGKNESIGAAGSVSAGKVGRAPEKYGCHAVNRGRELGE